MGGNCLTNLKVSGRDSNPGYAAALQAFLRDSRGPGTSGPIMDGLCKGSQEMVLDLCVSAVKLVCFQDFGDGP